ncbi:hypothetical protein WMF31_36085 [Sorangium sp. So ce1036]|uniref:hypothetical protein n=1 Tax=Sorangium sp. So ce1036 TaxID=3133328 RepID=UPI003EFDF16B
MLWLWYAGPLAVLVVWFLTGLRTRHEARRDREIARWRALMLPGTAPRPSEGRRGSRKATAEDTGPRPVRGLPSSLRQMLAETGGGEVIARYELVPKLAYVAIVGPDAKNGSEYQVVLVKLPEAGPEVTVCPLPILDGQPVPNNGVQFKKDPDFTAQFLVDGPNAKAIGRWLSRPVRDALRDFPDAWLFVRDRVMALVAYGPVDAERLQDLVAIADAIFAERGGEDAPPLLFVDEDEGDDEGDEDDDEDDDTEEGDDEDDEAAPDSGAERQAASAPAARAASRRS